MFDGPEYGFCWYGTMCIYKLCIIFSVGEVF